MLPRSFPIGNDLGNTHFTGALDLRANHCIYLHSPTLTNYKVLGPAGSRSSIARIAVNSGYGSILTHQHSGHPLEYIPCGGVTLRTLSCEVRNANAPIVEGVPEEANTPAVEEVTAPAPKRRGRPRKDPAAATPKKAVKRKPPPPPVTPESSDGEPIDRDDMETLLLD